MSSSAVANFRPNDPPTMPDQPSGATPAAPPLFSPDLAGEDQLGRDASARLLADLAIHPGAGTPFLIAIHGSAGTGKSTLLGQIVDRLRARSKKNEAETAQAAGPADLVARIDASNGAEPAPGILSAVFAALSVNYPNLAEEAVYAGGDPLKAARATSDRVTDLRRQHDAERQALDELGGRRARLVDTVLFNTPGSRIDAYARGNRGRIEARLRAFGLPVADPIATYKDLVREAAESDGAFSRLGMTLRAVWGFKGQGTLILLAILLLVIGWGSTYLAENQDVWTAWLNGFGDRFSGLSTWAQDHAGWLMPLSHAAYALAALTILIDIVRAIRFVQPVLRGASLLGGDLDGRRRDIDGLLAHQTRRVDHLASEVDTAVRSADLAERRVEARRAAGQLEPTLSADGEFGATPSPHATAEAFLSGLAAGMSTAGAQRQPAAGALHTSAAPRRIVVAIDELDRLSPAAAATYLETAHRLLRRPGFVTLAAVDRHHALSGFSDTDPALASSRLGRCVQLSYDLDAEASVAADLTRDADAGPPTEGEPGLDHPWQDFETRLLSALSAFVGPSPRSAKRFTNSYRVARADPKMAGATQAELAGLAVALALDESGAANELGSYQDGTAGRQPGERMQVEVGDAVETAQSAIGQRFNAADARRGLQVARIYSRRG